MKQRFIVTISALLIIAGVRAQTVADVLRQVNAAYAKAENISMDIRYDLYANYSASVPYETSNGFYVKQNNFFYSNLLGITTVQNKKYRLSVSDSEQIIIVGDPVKPGKTPGTVETDSLLKQCTSTQVRKTPEGQTICVLLFDQAVFCEFDKIEIEVGKGNFIQRMVLYYREAVSLDETNPQLKKEKPKLEIVYSNINTNPVIKAHQFSEKRFINDNGKQITCAPAYTNYRILNHKK